jgi:hypothetical protein
LRNAAERYLQARGHFFNHSLDRMKNLIKEGFVLLRIRCVGELHPASRHLVVKGQAGLCNRLWYLLGAMSFADRWGLTLSIDWRDGLYAPLNVNAFDELFRLNRPLMDPDEAYQGSIYPEYWRENPRSSFEVLHRALKQASGRSLGQKELMYPLWSLLLDKPAATTLLCTGYRFSSRELFLARACSNARMLASKLELSKTCEDFIDSELPRLQGCIGVHVRRTDSRRQVELEQYFRIIPNDDRPIFLCTDSVEVDDSFRERYGSRMVPIRRTYPQSGTRLHSAAHDVSLRSRMSLEAIRDLYGLSRCGMIVHGVNSSYSRYAIQVLADPSREVRTARPLADRWRRLAILR